MPHRPMLRRKKALANSEPSSPSRHVLSPQVFVIAEIDGQPLVSAGPRLVNPTADVFARGGSGYDFSSCKLVI